MISDTRCEKALRYLAETDEECAALKADMARQEYRVKMLQETVFLGSEGSVADRQAKAKTHDTIIEANERFFQAMKAYNAMAGKRATEAIVVECWRSIQANRRAGNIQ